MENRKQFTFFYSILESALRIKNKAARADFYDAICIYALTGQEPDLDKLSDAAAVGFISAKPNLDNSRKKAQSGKQGGSKPQANRKQTESKPKQTATEKEIEGEDEGEYEYENENDMLFSSSATAEKENTAAAAKAKFDQFWEKYPNKVGRSEALSAWIDLFYGDVKPANIPSIAAILAGLELWITSAEWAKEDGRFIPRPANWLSGRRWEESPPQSQTIPKGASGQLGQAELDAIKKMFAKE